MDQQLSLNWVALVEEAKRRRKTLGFTQQRLAALASISTPTVSRFENHKEDIQLSSILAILKVLGMLDTTASAEG